MEVKIIVIGLFLLVLVNSGCLGDKTKDEIQTPTITTPPVTAPQTPEPLPKEFINESLEGVCKIFGRESELTYQQQVEIFESRYKDKYVKWSGKVDTILDIPSYIIMSVNLTSTCDINVFFDDFEQMEILDSMEKGTYVTFLAQLFGHSYFPSLVARDGEIVT